MRRLSEERDGEPQGRTQGRREDGPEGRLALTRGVFSGVQDLLPDSESARSLDGPPRVPRPTDSSRGRDPGHRHRVGHTVNLRLGVHPTVTTSTPRQRSPVHASRRARIGDRETRRVIGHGEEPVPPLSHGPVGTSNPKSKHLRRDFTGRTTEVPIGDGDGPTGPDLPYPTRRTSVEGPSPWIES